MNDTRTVIDSKLWSRVTASGDCWIWAAETKNSDSTYGKFSLNGRMVLAHRVAYECAVGPIPAGFVIDHICHMLRCVNPEHLQAVTVQANGENRSGPTAISTSGVRGVSWNKRLQQWQAYAARNGKRSHGGYYDSIPEAEAAAIALRMRIQTNNILDRVAA